MKHFKLIPILLSVLLLTVAFSSCSKDDNRDDSEYELYLDPNKPEWVAKVVAEMMSGYKKGFVVLHETTYKGTDYYCFVDMLSSNTYTNRYFTMSGGEIDNSSKLFAELVLGAMQKPNIPSTIYTAEGVSQLPAEESEN